MTSNTLKTFSTLINVLSIFEDFSRTFQGLFWPTNTYVLHNHYNRYNLLTFPNLYCRFISSKLHFYIHFFCWDGKTRFMGTDLCIQKKIGTTLQFFLPLTTAHCACTNKAVGISSVVKFLWSWALQRKIFLPKKTHTSHYSDLREKNCSSDWEKLLKLEAEGREFPKFLRSLDFFFTQWNSYSLYPQIRLIPLSILWNFDPKICIFRPTIKQIP